MQQGVEAVDKQIEEAKVKFEQAKQQALQQAEKAKEIVAQASIWSFVSLLIAAVLSAFMGRLRAARARNRYALADADAAYTNAHRDDVASHHR